MKTADLYVRVSTDEQAEKGYSQRDQDERLRKYCALNNIEIRKVIFEDYSAKTFNRPEWKKLLLTLKKEKGKSDLILFTKWDRFSRNTGDAYQMISILRRNGVEPQAIEQPLDMEIPESKLMLAVYLAAPEVENDRRALNVFYGIRRAKKEGRYHGLAPTGYINKSTEDGRKYIAIHEPHASIMRWAFEEIADGAFNTEQVYKMAKEKGLKGNKSNFWFNLRNPMYCGKIFIPKFKDEPAFFVKGKHEPLISEELFYQVQDLLDGRGRIYRPKPMVLEELPLRGFLLCPQCNRPLTGSKSKGATKYYSYYHCRKECRARFRSEIVHEAVKKELNKYIPRFEMAKIYERLLREAYYNQAQSNQVEKKQTLLQIKEIEYKLSKARELLVTDKIDASDYKSIKGENEEKLSKLESKLNTIGEHEENLDDLLKTGISNLMKLEIIYEMESTEKKRRLISSIFPEKLKFVDNGVRTTKVNEVVSLIYRLEEGFSQNKNWTSEKNSHLSSEVGTTRFELATPCTPCKCATGLRYVPNFFLAISPVKDTVAVVFQRRDAKVIIILNYKKKSCSFLKTNPDSCLSLHCLTEPRL